MNNYITLDGYKYTTTHRKWGPSPIKSGEARLTLTGALDLTFGPGVMYEFKGESRADVTPRGAGWGTPTNLEASLAKNQSLQLTDHFGNTFTVAHFDGYQPDSLSPMWDGTSNTMVYALRLIGVKN
jgi:hypothetical protein